VEGAGELAGNLLTDIFKHKTSGMRDVGEFITGAVTGDPGQPQSAPQEQQYVGTPVSVEIGGDKKGFPATGTTISEILTERGDPRGRLDQEGTTVLSYKDAMMTFKDGRLKEVTPLTIEEAEPSTSGEAEDEGKETSPIRKIMMVEEIISSNPITPRGATMIRGSVARRAIEDGLDPELVGAWVGGGYEGIGNYFKSQRERQGAEGAEGTEATTLQRQLYMRLLDEMSELDKDFAKELEKESGRDVWNSNIFFNIGAKPDRRQALLALLSRDEYAPLLVNPPPSLVPVVRLLIQEELQRRSSGE
jgi:hypothetical protein